MTRTRTRTFEVNGEKIEIRSVARTYDCQPCGYNVFINGNKYFCSNYLERNEAEDYCFTKWIKELNRA